MAITDINISEQLETSAPSIKYEGNEGPKSPQEQQQMMMAQLEEEYSKYVFEMEEQGLEPMSIQQFIEQAMAEGQISSAQPMPNRQMAAYGGIMGVDGRKQYGIGSWLKEKARKLIPNEVARVAEVAAPFVAPFNPLAAGLMSGIGGFDRTGSIGSSLKSGLMNYGGGQAARYLGGADFQGLQNPFARDAFSMPTGSGGIKNLFKGKPTDMTEANKLGLHKAPLIQEGGDGSVMEAVYSAGGDNKPSLKKAVKEGTSGIMRFIDKNAKAILLGSMGLAAATATPQDMQEAVRVSRGTGLDIDAIRAEVQEAFVAGEEAWNELKNKYPYIGDFSTKKAEGGRIGLYAGGQSTPSDYTMEDAMMTTTQDKLGGITDVMKQADLYRQGSVGQFYAANGGSPNNDRLMERVKELQDEGLSWDAAWAQAHNELRDKNAQGGRIGYNVGQLVTPGIAGIGRPGYGGDDTYHKILEEEMAKIAEALDIHVSDLSDKDYEKAGDIAYKKYHSGDWGGAQGGRIGADEGGLMDLGGMEKDYRNDGGFVPLGGEEKADDVPARLSKNEFVFTADAVRGAGGGDIDKGAEIMENIMKNLEQGGQISEETQGLGGAQEMFETSQRLGEVV